MEIPTAKHGNLSLSLRRGTNLALPSFFQESLMHCHLHRLKGWSNQWGNQTIGSTITSTGLRKNIRTCQRADADGPKGCDPGTYDCWNNPGTCALTRAARALTFQKDSRLATLGPVIHSPSHTLLPNTEHENLGWRTQQVSSHTTWSANSFDPEMSGTVLRPAWGIGCLGPPRYRGMQKSRSCITNKDPTLKLY